MTDSRDVPTFEEFLTLAPAEVAPAAPKTLIYSGGGSRRAAILAGLAVPSDAYVRWTYAQLLKSIDLLFRHGVEHMFVPTLLPNQFNEISCGYRERMVADMRRELGGETALSLYQARGWRVRLLGTDAIPELAGVDRQLRTQTTAAAGRTLWWFTVPRSGLHWEWLLAAAQRSGATNRADLLRALYGEDVPPATLLLSFGKPIFNHDLLPPLLIGDMQCYWLERPGYLNSVEELRAIFYDYAYTRRTWRSDKTGRAEAALAHREVWERAPILGVGSRIGPFWYPASNSQGRQECT